MHIFDETETYFGIIGEHIFRSLLVRLGVIGISAHNICHNAEEYKRNILNPQRLSQNSYITHSS